MLHVCPVFGLVRWLSVSAVIITHSTHWLCEHLYNVSLFFSGSALSKVVVRCLGDSYWLMCDHMLGIYVNLRKKQKVTKR